MSVHLQQKIIISIDSRRSSTQSLHTQDPHGDDSYPPFFQVTVGSTMDSVGQTAIVSQYPFPLLL